MVVYCGFFNSVNGDKQYQAEEMCRPYESLISNGVFATPQGTPSDYLQVYASGSMGVTVRPGKGMFFDKWLINDADLFLPIDAAEVTLKRIDSVVVRIDKTETVRAGTIYIKKGTPSSSPTAPSLERTDYIKEYKLANITINAGVTSITQAVIEDRRPYNEDCGWVTSLIQQVDTSTLWEQWQAGFMDWFSRVKDTLASATLIRSYSSVYYTTEPEETIIPIGISRYNRDYDILEVHINGLKLNAEEYTGNNNNTHITLTYGVNVGTAVSFTVYKSVDGTNAESVVGEVAELFGRVEGLEGLRVTAEDGTSKFDLAVGENILEHFMASPMGYHTYYCINGVEGLPAKAAYRVFGHKTTADVGWLIAMRSNGSVYANYHDVDTWRGWKVLCEAVPETLYISTAGAFPNANWTITPTKPLNECQHGWQLVFTLYDYANNVARDTFTQSVFIPKRSYKGANWSGEGIGFPLVYNNDGAICIKKFEVYNDRFVSDAINSSGDNRNMVIRAIYEY